jgi:hypothetical protein
VNKLSHRHIRILRKILRYVKKKLSKSEAKRRFYAASKLHTFLTQCCKNFVILFSREDCFHLCYNSIIFRYPTTAYRWTHKWTLSLLVILPSWCYGFIWALFPLLGWSNYEHEYGSRHRCSINWHPNSLSYSYSLFVGGFGLPLLIISYTSYNVRKALSRMRNSLCSLGVINLNMQMRRKRMVVKHTVMAFILIFTFLAAWTPYAVCVVVLTVQGSTSASLLSMAALLSKMSTLFNPILYMFFMKDFRTAFRRLFGCPSNTVFVV